MDGAGIKIYRNALYDEAYRRSGIRYNRAYKNRDNGSCHKKYTISVVDSWDAYLDNEWSNENQLPHYVKQSEPDHDELQGEFVYTAAGKKRAAEVLAWVRKAHPGREIKIKITEENNETTVIQ
jgi:hypothetical protein